MEYILETKGLTKVYGRKEAARDVNLHIREGQIYGLIGRNGAGKTTIMRMISGLSTPTRGSYSLFGKTGYQMEKMLKYVGVLIEHPGLYPRLSAYENLKIKCLAMGIQPKGYVEQLLELIGLENTERNKPAGAYSLGMRQRLGIGLALVGNPKIIILDEPINVADAYGIINEGTLLDEFSADELHKRSGQYVLIRTEDTAKALQALKAMGIQKAETEPDGAIRVSEGIDNTAAMAKAIVQADAGLKEIYLNTISLEDYYLGVTGGGKHNG